jgi:hypothetical protein
MNAVGLGLSSSLSWLLEPGDGVESPPSYAPLRLMIDNLMLARPVVLWHITRSAWAPDCGARWKLDRLESSGESTTSFGVETRIHPVSNELPAWPANV